MDRCFFCDNIIIPRNMITTEEVTNFFKRNGLEFTLNYTRSRTMIGNKIICLSCEEDLRSISCYKEDCDCEDCKQQREFEERFGI